jgi:hypothetical protein
VLPLALIVSVPVLVLALGSLLFRQSIRLGRYTLDSGRYSALQGALELDPPPGASGYSWLSPEGRCYRALQLRMGKRVYFWSLAD